MLLSILQRRLVALEQLIQQLAATRVCLASERAECTAAEWQQACDGIDVLAKSEIDILQQALCELDVDAKGGCLLSTEA
jgi:hypothetical protein